MTDFQLGTHNLHDQAGVPTFFADVLLFTEAIAPTIVTKAKQKRARAAARLGGYTVVVCKEQRDLVVAFRRRLFKRAGATSYRRYVDGIAKVTPNRGTFVLPLEHRATGIVFDVLVEHRINAAWPPFVRGEGAFRAHAWEVHTSGTLDTIDHRIQRTVVGGSLPSFVLAGGDDNTPDGIEAYNRLEMRGFGYHVQERGAHFDRLAAISRTALPRRMPRLGRAVYLSREGSDHPRLRAEVILPKEVAPHR